MRNRKLKAIRICGKRKTIDIQRLLADRENLLVQSGKRIQRCGFNFVITERDPFPIHYPPLYY
jgi:hypothetical protein